MEASTRGAYIREKRRAKEWNQDDLAEKVGVSRNAISDWENDNYRSVITGLKPKVNIDNRYNEGLSS